MGEAILARVSGGGNGGPKYASGEFTPSAHLQSISLDIGFEPTKILVESVGIYNGSSSNAWVETLRNGTLKTNGNNSTTIPYMAYCNNGNVYYYRDVCVPTVTYDGGILSISCVKTAYYSYPVYFRSGLTYKWYAWAE